MKKDAELFLKHFGIKHLSDLIGRKFLINIKFRQHDDHRCENEICFQINQYHFSGKNLDFIVPTIGLEGNNDIKNINLTFFTNSEETEIEHGISFYSDYGEIDTKGRGPFIIVEGDKRTRNFRIRLI